MIQNTAATKIFTLFWHNFPDELERRRNKAEMEEQQRQKEQEEEWSRQEALRIQQQEDEEAAKRAALEASSVADQRYDLPPEVRT